MHDYSALGFRCLLPPSNQSCRADKMKLLGGSALGSVWGWNRLLYLFGFAALLLFNERVIDGSAFCFEQRQSSW
ncbi:MULTISPECIES: hypothetical protein [unclassified Collinsella]|uniref:hypothetical protein n=1 Tax=unclassified Collinsella TaxID=2637548 RepID=UPI003F92163C